MPRGVPLSPRLCAFCSTSWTPVRDEVECCTRACGARLRRQREGTTVQARGETMVSGHAVSVEIRDMLPITGALARDIRAAFPQHTQRKVESALYWMCVRQSIGWIQIRTTIRRYYPSQKLADIHAEQARRDYAAANPPKPSKKKATTPKPPKAQSKASKPASAQIVYAKPKSHKATAAPTGPVIGMDTARRTVIPARPDYRFTVDPSQPVPRIFSALPLGVYLSEQAA